MQNNNGAEESGPLGVRHILELRDQPIFVVTATDGESHSGMVITWLTQVSLVGEVPRFLIVISPHNFTSSLLAKSGEFRLHLLSADQIHLVERFGLHTGRLRDKFESIDAIQFPDQPALLGKTCGWLLCSVVSTVQLEDRLIVTAAAYDSHLASAAGPPLMTSHAFSCLPSEITERLRTKLEDDSYRDALMVKHAVGLFPRLMV